MSTATSANAAFRLPASKQSLDSGGLLAGAVGPMPTAIASAIALPGPGQPSATTSTPPNLPPHMAQVLTAYSNAIAHGATGLGAPSHLPVATAMAISSCSSLESSSSS